MKFIFQNNDNNHSIYKRSTLHSISKHIFKTISNEIQSSMFILQHFVVILIVPESEVHIYLPVNSA